MNRLSIVIADDEPLALRRIAQLLEESGAATVCASVSNGEEALAAVAAHRPDLLLLDIEMPRRDGFDVIEALRPGQAAGTPAPLIVFVTAYPEFAALAFETGAIDFLTKPVRLARLQNALERARAALDAREATRRLAQLQDMLDALRAGHAQQQDNQALWIHGTAELLRIDPNTIKWVQAEGEYVRLHVGERSFLHRALIGQFVEQLDPARFVRVHRSYVVRRDHVERVSRNRWGALQLHLCDGQHIPVGRKYSAAASSIYR
jgi:two-component system LytT family response regulator